MMAAMTLAAAFLLDSLLGDPHYSWHPIALMGRGIAFLERLIRRILPKSPPAELAGGALLAGIMMLISVMFPALLLYAAWRIHPILLPAVHVILCYQLLAARSLRDESMKVCHALEQQDLEKARAAVSMIVGRDTETLDEAGIIRAAVETVAENTSDGVIAPMLFMAIGGAPLGFLYKAVNTMDSMLGYKNDRYLYFGRAAARLDDIFNFLPARIAGILMVFAAGLLRLDAGHAWKIFRRDRKKHDSPNSAHTEAACAGALHIQLGGDSYYFGKLHHKDKLGEDDRPAVTQDIGRACRLMYVTAVLNLGLCVLICMALHREGLFF